MASGQKIIKEGGVWTVDGRPRETIKYLSRKQFPNIPGMTLITITVTLPAGGALPPHRHGGSAVTACMVKGTILNQMNDEEPFEAHAGETFSEQPGCHHVRGENNTEEEASFFGIYVIDTKKLEEDPGCVFQLDADMEEKERNGEVESAPPAMPSTFDIKRLNNGVESVKNFAKDSI